MSSSEQKVISDLADEDLANIFKQLPPYERLLISEVNKRWYRISRIPWRDVVNLDLSPIPRENIGAIFKQCPTLHTVFAKNKDLSLSQLQFLTHPRLSSLKLYGCSLREHLGVSNENIPLLSGVFPENLSTANCGELILDDFTIPAVREIYLHSCVAVTLPSSLERLQLMHVRLALPLGSSAPGFANRAMCVEDLGHLSLLTCLSLCAWTYPSNCCEQVLGCHSKVLQGLKSLRELCIGYGYINYFTFGKLVFLDLPRLEVLFLNSALFHGDRLGNLTKHPTLRILCITGSFARECTVPVRCRFPNGFGSDPMQTLHVFVGKQASEQIIFTKSPADALEIHPITEPLPAFLGKAEIAPLFEGVWLAAQIKESAKHGSSWWKYEGDTATSFRSADDA